MDITTPERAPAATSPSESAWTGELRRVELRTGHRRRAEQPGGGGSRTLIVDLGGLDLHGQRWAGRAPFSAAVLMTGAEPPEPSRAGTRSTPSVPIRRAVRSAPASSSRGPHLRSTVCSTGPASAASSTSTPTPRVPSPPPVPVGRSPEPGDAMDITTERPRNGRRRGRRVDRGAGWVELRAGHRYRPKTSARKAPITSSWICPG